jgi:CRISPR-associated exonuclease Cas4
MITLTPSHIIQYLYCPRFTYFEYVLGIPQFEEKFFLAMKGRDIHDEKLERNKDYLRKRIGVVEKYTDQYLTNDYLRGRVDEVVLLTDGTMAPLDYKFAVYDEKVYSTYQTQLQCYAILIESNFNTQVNRGFLVYVRSKNKLVEVDISENDKENVRNCFREIAKIIDRNFFPKATGYKKRCLTCTYQNICVK